MELRDRVREAYAGVLGARAQDVALTGSTTDGVNTVIAGLDLREGDEVLTTDEEHPGLLAPLGVPGGATASRSASSRSARSHPRFRRRRS